ncbi:hypothetical protein M378DRAFT_530280 [Amanita muscaria Koide BX008]|uniref:Uncharacterized protein n=1 Tax=Amanita muscaria (strain Koide BX008) TaxID=946122 RepID=A0A0C2X9Q2_AMAMK|nr:hypothetical protein M378DRAFT_530280 [Amanita muscaria Koide BX008]
MDSTSNKGVLSPLGGTTSMPFNEPTTEFGRESTFVMGGRRVEYGHVHGCRMESQNSEWVFTDRGTRTAEGGVKVSRINVFKELSGEIEEELGNRRCVALMDKSRGGAVSKRSPESKPDYEYANATRHFPSQCR